MLHCGKNDLSNSLRRPCCFLSKLRHALHHVSKLRAWPDGKSKSCHRSSKGVQEKALGVPSCLTGSHAARAAAQSCPGPCPSRTGCTLPCRTCPDHHILCSVSLPHFLNSAVQSMLDPSKSKHLLNSAVHSTLNKASTNTCWIVQCDLDLTMLHTLLSGASHTILSGASRLEAFTTSSCRSKSACSCSCVLLSAGSDSVMLYNAGNVCVCRLVFSLACSRHLNERQMAVCMETEQRLE